MAQKVGIDGLEAAIKKILSEYQTEAERVTKDCVRKAGLAGARTLRGTSPRRSGSYAGDWKAKAEESRLYSKSTVYNKEHYRLAHLLEHGHAIRNQYGSYGSTPAYSHIRPVEDAIVEQFETKLIVGLTKG